MYYSDEECKEMILYMLGSEFILKNHHTMYNLFGKGIWVLVSTQEQSLKNYRSLIPIYVHIDSLVMLCDDIELYKFINNKSSLDTPICAVIVRYTDIKPQVGYTSTALICKWYAQSGKIQTRA